MCINKHTYPMFRLMNVAMARRATTTHPGPVVEIPHVTIGNLLIERLNQVNLNHGISRPFMAMTLCDRNGEEPSNIAYKRFLHDRITTYIQTRAELESRPGHRLNSNDVQVYFTDPILDHRVELSRIRGESRYRTNPDTLLWPC